MSHYEAKKQKKTKSLGSAEDRTATLSGSERENASAKIRR